MAAARIIVLAAFAALLAVPFAFRPQADAVMADWRKHAREAAIRIQYTDLFRTRYREVVDLARMFPSRTR